jgi:hypothetical protein
MDVSRNRDLPAEQSATEAATGVTLETLKRASRGTKKYILYIDSREKFRPDSDFI